MSDNRPTAETAVARALALARQNAATAAVALGIVPLAALAATPAHASVGGNVSVSVTAGGYVGAYTLSYSVTNTFSSPVRKIEIPEIHLGDIVFAPSGSNGSGGFSGVGGAAGWTATQVTVATLSGAGLYSGTAAGYVDLATTGYGIGSGSTLSFVASVPTTTTANAAFEVAFANSPPITVDPGIPNTGATPVPEPSSVLALGTALLGLLAVRRRRA